MTNGNFLWSTMQRLESMENHNVKPALLGAELHVKPGECVGMSQIYFFFDDLHLWSVK